MPLFVSTSLSASRAFCPWTSSADGDVLDRDHSVVCFLGAALLVIFGLVHSVVDPLAWDPWLLRGGLAGAALVLPVAYRLSAIVRLYFRPIFHFLLYVFTFWIVIVCAVNGFPPSYSAGLIFAVVATVTVLSFSASHSQMPLIYLASSLTFIAIGLAATPGDPFEQAQFIACVAGSGTSVYLMAARRMRAQRALEISETRSRAAADFFEAALSRLPLEVAVFDSHARYVYVNPSAVADESVRKWMVGKTSVEYAIHRGLNPETFHERYEWLLDVIRTKVESRHEESVTGRSGQTKHLLRVASPVLDRNGEVVQIFAYGVDLTDRKEFEEQLLEAKERAEEMLRLKSAFLNNMSHEIRTPLTGILGFANVLAEEATGQTREFATGIARGAVRLHEMLESVLELARLESGRYPLECGAVDVVAEVNNSTRLLGICAKDKNLYLRVAHRHPMAVALADAGCVSRILNNLIGNAIKFTGIGGISVTTNLTDEHVVVRIEDTGIGISDTFLPLIFEAFHQESTGFSRTHEGVGLGLAITRRVIDLLDGDIEVESRKGKGTAFTVRLPRADMAAGGDGQSEDARIAELDSQVLD